eukprot:m.33147 g.33147  ORF g.33147 m.33147 type:complete len:63 (+) comp7159_c0_seq1:2980-3168(+)
MRQILHLTSTVCLGVGALKLRSGLHFNERSWCKLATSTTASTRTESAAPSTYQAQLEHTPIR